MSNFMGQALNGLWYGLALGVVILGALFYLGKQRHWFDERTRAIKERAARPTLGIGIILLLVALVWSQARPAQSSLVIFAVLGIEVGTYWVLYLLAARRL